MDGCFDGVDCVEGIGWEIQVLLFGANLVARWAASGKGRATHHKITLEKGYLFLETSLFRMPCRPGNLIPIIIDPNDPALGELCNLSRWPAYAATDIQHFHPLLDSQHVGQVMLMPRESLQERLPDTEAAEVKGLAPCLLVEVRDEVIVASCVASESNFTGTEGKKQNSLVDHTHVLG